MRWVSKLIKIQTVGTRNSRQPDCNISKNNCLNIETRYNYTANTDGRKPDEQTWRRLKRITIVFFENLLA